MSMGCDIHSFAEKRDGGIWQYVDVECFADRNYSAFGFLAGVRNYSAIKPISEPRGIPSYTSPEVLAQYKEWDTDAHTPSWLLLSELNAIDYEQSIEDRRCTVQRAPNWFDGGGTCAPGAGNRMSLREFLGSVFMDDVRRMTEAGAERIVFWFDN